MSQKSLPASLRLVTTAINAALYAIVGVLSAPLPTFFGIRIWPQVFVPASFAVLFGPWTGGVGAAIGIFLADVIYGHHDALLSLLVGVPANFLGFYVIGWLTQRNHGKLMKNILFLFSLLIPILLAVYGLYYISEGTSAAQIVLGFVWLVGIPAVAIIALKAIRSRWADFEMAASIGLGFGSVIIGVGLVAYSSIFALPSVLGLGGEPLPITFIYGATAFTYLTEILALVVVTPVVVTACRAAFPSLRGFGAITRQARSGKRA